MHQHRKPCYLKKSWGWCLSVLSGQGVMWPWLKCRLHQQLTVQSKASRVESSWRQCWWRRPPGEVRQQLTVLTVLSTQGVLLPQLNCRQHR
jgi:hypothetical protein